MKNFRNTKLYKEMTPYLASAIVEGFCEGEGATQEEQLIAWQFLHDTKIGYSLQGWYGRTLQVLLRNGNIEDIKTQSVKSLLHKI